MINQKANAFCQISKNRLTCFLSLIRLFCVCNEIILKVIISRKIISTIFAQNQRYSTMSHYTILQYSEPVASGKVVASIKNIPTAAHSAAATGWSCPCYMEQIDHQSIMAQTTTWG